MSDLTIARAAGTAGVGVETIRFYERRGLIEQPRKPAGGGFRKYDADTIARIRFIRQAQELGFSLREIQDLLSLRADPGADCADVRTRAIAKRDEVERKITELGRIRAALDALIATCPGRRGTPRLHDPRCHRARGGRKGRSTASAGARKGDEQGARRFDRHEDSDFHDHGVALRRLRRDYQGVVGQGTRCSHHDSIVQGRQCAGSL
jgi:MerR family copper efflux transcriptional regulator